jgi:hypothetical protein
VSAPEAPVLTDVQQLTAAYNNLSVIVEQQTEAINSLGANVQWIIDNVQGIFQMFQNPAFLSQMPMMMGGGQNADGPQD